MERVTTNGNCPALIFSAFLFHVVELLLNHNKLMLTIMLQAFWHAMHFKANVLAFILLNPDETAGPKESNYYTSKMCKSPHAVTSLNNI